MTTLDEYTKLVDIPRIRLWKLDMEGYEPQALAGAKQLLSQQRIDALLIEAQTSTISLIKDILSIGYYSLFCINKVGKLDLFNDAFWAYGFEGNLIALPSRSRSF